MIDSVLIKKLGIRQGHKVLILNAPEGYMQSLRLLPENTEVTTSAEGTFDFVQSFVYNKADADSHAATAIRALKPGGVLWFSYPKKSSKVETDITRDVGWEAVRSMGLRPVSQVAIDDTWSALRFRPTGEVKSRKKV